MRTWRRRSAARKKREADKGPGGKAEGEDVKKQAHTQKKRPLKAISKWAFLFSAREVVLLFAWRNCRNGFEDVFLSPPDYLLFVWPFLRQLFLFLFSLGSFATPVRVATAYLFAHRAPAF